MSTAAPHADGRPTPAEGAALLEDDRITAAGLLFEVAEAVSCSLGPQLLEHGLSPVETQVVMRLARSPQHRLRMSDLATQAGLSASGLTRVVDRLERVGLVRREACVSDRRVTYATLTQSGIDKVLAVLPGHIETIEQVFTGLLGDDERDALLRSLRTVRDAIRPGATAGAEPESVAGADVARV